MDTSVTKIEGRTIKAYAVRLKGGDITTIVFAESAAKARWRAVSGAREAGYDIPWSGVSSSHAPDYDQWYHPKMAGMCLDPADVRDQYNHLKACSS